MVTQCGRRTVYDQDCCGDGLIIAKLNVIDQEKERKKKKEKSQF